MKKCCKICKNLKSLNEFKLDSRNKDGHTGKCSHCTSLHQKAYDAKFRNYKEKYIKRAATGYFKAYVLKIKDNPEYKKKQKILRDRKRSTPKGKLDVIFGNHIRQALKAKKAGRRWEIVVGYTLNDLMTHLELLFTEGMTWENHGEWHIDHIKPICSFDYLDDKSPEFKKCWSLGNLRPLWAKDNLAKVSKDKQLSIKKRN